MNYNLIILPRAARDIKNAAKWYNLQNLGLGNHFMQNLRLKGGEITQNPYAFAVKYENVRVALLAKFPYLIHYFVDELKNEILVLAVLHTSRNPDIWKSLYKT